MDSILHLELFIVLMTLLAVSEATLVSSVSVACPGQTVSFTCTSPSSNIRWTVDPPPGSGLSPARSGFLSAGELDQTFTFGSTGFMFQAVLTDASGGNLTTTLTTITEVSSLSGSMVTCSGQDPLTIQVADSPSSPLNPMLIGFQNETNTSVVTLQWAPPTSTSGVDVGYVLAVSPPPVSGSTITTQTSTDITVSYNIQYNVTIRTENCAGSSQDSVVVFELVSCSSSPSTADGVVLNNVPSVTTEGSILIFTCMGTSDMVTSTCGSDGMWSPEPADYVCVVPTMATTMSTTPPSILCGFPPPPSNGSVNSGNQSPPYVEGTIVTFQCDDGLFPNDTMTATCRNLSGRGEWEPNPADVVCRIEPVICILPDLPVNGVIVNYCNINTAEGSVITFQCNPGFLPEGEMTATCTNAGVWSPDPAGVDCSYNVETPTSNSFSIGGAVGISVVLSFIVSIIIGLVVGAMLMYCVMRRQIHKGNNEQKSPLHQQTIAPQQQTPPPPPQQQTTPAGPVYEEVSLPKEEIELKTNQAYGPVSR